MVLPESQADSQSLSTVLEFQDPRRPQWSDRDLEEMVRHQLAAPLCLSLGTLSAEVSHAIQLTEGQIDPRITLGQLLAEPQPPVQLLKLVKRFAKLCRSDVEGALPNQIVMLLYYVSITMAQVRGGQSISHLSAASLRRGIGWLMAQAWLPQEMRGLLKECLKGVS